MVDGNAVTVSHPGFVWVRYSYSMNETWTKVDMRKGRSRTAPKLPKLQQKYDTLRGVKESKLRDLQKMIPYLPTCHRAFYENLPHQESEDVD